MDKVNELSEELFKEVENRFMHQYSKNHWPAKLRKVMNTKMEAAFHYGQISLDGKINALNSSLQKALSRPQPTLGHRLKYLFTGKL